MSSLEIALPTCGSSAFNMPSLHSQLALPRWTARLRFWGCRFDSKPIYRQSLTAFFPGYMLRGVPRGGFLHVQSANSVSAGHCCTNGGQMRCTLYERGQIMTSASAARRELRTAGRLCLPLALL